MSLDIVHDVNITGHVGPSWAVRARSASPSPTATYPALWNHHAGKETPAGLCEPDSQLLVRKGMEAKAPARVWETAGRAHREP